MKRRTVYILMLVISVSTAAVFTFLFINNSGDIPTGLQAVINPSDAPQFKQHLDSEFGDSLAKPMDVTKSNSFIFVTDTNNKRIVVYDLAGSPLYKFGEEGNKPGQFRFPYGISADNKGNIFVADLYNGNISIFDEKGKFIKYFAEQSVKDKKITSPAGLRIINEKVYVTDIQQNKVMVFDLQGKLLQEIGKPGTGEGEFMAPNAVTADKEGNVYVVDTGNQRVQAFDKDGKFVRVINGTKNGQGESYFVNPRGIGIDSRGYVYVVSNLTHIVYGFTKEGEQVFQFGSMGEGNGQFQLPNGLFLDDDDNVLITDTLNLRVSVFN
ncbi:6-bladed beta-propeller [Bacillus sp. FJAT-27225]|uniref:6-bladed beta-propeller n=1 Tax=Bacillus sp. FJAT-27225 TaxID=1743144 RepID=UPI00080C3031|nr:6-bladed beta-propeller [Bacillus sp. FJAT-27225]OCA88249.1 6-bladed beta-propeller [Bacillus sp. FJAT-27225]